jgi:hypothetical protein
MVLSLSISNQAEAILKAKASAAGVDLPTYVSGLIEQSARAPLSIQEISGPVADDFAKTGMTEDELSDVLEDAKHQMRAEKQKRRGA